MKKIMLFTIIIISLSAFATGLDLADYPDMFFDEGTFNAYLVVGKQGTATDVVTMTNILLSLGKQTSERIKDADKLDSEITNSESQNIISIGSPCNNIVSNELLGGGDCNQYINPGKAYLKLLRNNGNYQLIVAAKSDQGIKKLGDVLIKNQNLESDYYEVSYDEPLSQQEEQEEQEEDVPQNIPDVETQKKIDPEEIVNPIEANNDPKAEPVTEKVIVEDKGFFKKIFNWFVGIFI